jgi:peptidoglycan L-alanyl-D-glutamate endopeptidase CwlK
MSKFSAISNERLATCDERLQMVFREVIKHFDCCIIEGHRGQTLQHLYFTQGKSKLDWPNGEHNRFPSRAVDAMPYPIDWKDVQRDCYFAGFVVGIGLTMGIKIRWGKDWDGDTDLNDQTFCDGPHFEVIE